MKPVGCISQMVKTPYSSILEEIEVGHGFLTFYSRKLPELLELGNKLYNALPNKLQMLQRKDLVHIPGDPNIFHPFGEPNQWRKAFRHFHIIYPERPTDDDIFEIQSILTSQFGIPTLPVTQLYNHIPEDMHESTMIELDNKSRELLRLWLERRTETIDELLPEIP